MSANQHFSDAISKLERENPELGASDSKGGAGYIPSSQRNDKGYKSPEERKRLQKIKDKVFSKATYYARQFEGRKKRKQEYKEKREEAHGEGYHFKQEGTQSGYFDPEVDAYQFSGPSSQRYYQSPEGSYDPADFTPDMLVPKYIDIFGVNSARDILYAKEKYYDITGEGLWTESVHDQAYLNTRKITPEYLRADDDYKTAASVGLEMFEAGELDFEGFNALLSYYKPKDKDFTPTSAEIFKANNPNLAYREPRTLGEAKQLADQAYINSLERDLKRNVAMQDFGDSGYKSLADLKLEEQTIRKAIEKGALDFQNPEDTTYILYNGGESAYNAARDQAFLMKGFLEDNDIDLYKTVELEPNAGADSTGIIQNKVWLNTGTALQAFETGGGMRADVAYGQTANSTMGAYSFYETTPVYYEGKQKFKNAFSIFSDIVSTIYPPAAPIAKAANAVVQGGDLEDALKAGGTAYATNKFAEVTSEEILKGFDDLNIDVRALPENVQNVIIDTSKATLQGDSGSDAFKKSATGALLDSVDIDIDLPDTDFKTPQAIKDIGNAIVSGAEAVGDVVEDILKPPLDFIGETFEEGLDFVADTFEPAVDFLDEKLDALGESYVDPALQAAKEAGQSIIDPVDDVLDEFGKSVIDPALQATKDLGQETIDVIADLGEPVVDVIDEGLDVFGEKVVDPALQAGKEFGQDVIDVGSDVLSEAEDIVIEPIKEGVEYLSNVDLPDVSLPDIDLPDWDLPDWDLPDFDFNFSSPSRGMLLRGGGEEKRTPTEELFDKELFKFDTEIKPSEFKFNPRTNLRKYG